LLLELRSGFPHPADERTFDNIVTQEVDERAEKAVTERNQHHQIAKAVARSYRLNKGDAITLFISV